VPAYLRAESDGESELNHAARTEIVWEAWVAALRAGGAPAVPGETTAGIGRFLSTLAAGSATVQTLPVEELVSDADGEPELEPHADEVAALVASIVPFPAASGPGSRTRVRLLNGTTDAAATSRAARLLVRERAEIVVLGNAERFGIPETEVVYYDVAAEETARRLAEALSGAKVVREDRSPAAAEVVDATVRLGQDFIEENDAEGG
jgi:hypothetical protein